MSIREELLIKKLPEHNFNVAETARAVGYAPSSCRNTGIYNEKKREKILKMYAPENVKVEINRAMKDFKKQGDNSNRARMLELIAKISGIVKEQTNQGNIAIFSDIESLVKNIKPLVMPRQDEITEMSTTPNVTQPITQQEDTGRKS